MTLSTPALATVSDAAVCQKYLKQHCTKGKVRDIYNQREKPV